MCYRSKELESMCNTAMLQGVGVQAIVTEFLIQYADLIFSDKLQSVPNDTGRSFKRQLPISLTQELYICFRRCQQNPPLRDFTVTN